MNAVTYNIPAHLFESYQGRKVIVRSDNPNELVIYLSRANLENVLYAQLTSLTVELDLDPLLSWTCALPIDVLVRNPAAEYPLLYHFSRLLDKHPVRISIPVKKGFVKAVRLALALGFSVKLEVGQPDVCLIGRWLKFWISIFIALRFRNPLNTFTALFSLSSITSNLQTFGSFKRKIRNIFVSSRMKVWKLSRRGLGKSI